MLKFSFVIGKRRKTRSQCWKLSSKRGDVFLAVGEGPPSFFRFRPDGTGSWVPNPQQEEESAQMRWDGQSVAISDKATILQLLVIMFPTDHLTRSDKPIPDSVTWIESAPRGQATRLIVFATRAHQDHIEAALDKRSRLQYLGRIFGGIKVGIVSSYVKCDPVEFTAPRSDPSGGQYAFGDLVFPKRDTKRTGRPIRMTLVFPAKEGSAVATAWEVGGYEQTTKPKSPEFDVLSWFQLDALEMSHARERGRLANLMLNIRSSGDEIERTVRATLTRRLEHSAYVTHGHLVDTGLKVSPQLDVIVAQRELFPVLNVLKDGSEHVAFSSVYAVGEVKSSYELYRARSNSILAFCARLKWIKTNLTREHSSLEDIIPGLRLSFGNQFTLISEPSEPYQNPLFAFMIIVNSDGFKPEHIKKYYIETEDQYLPNVVCLLDRGLIINCAVNVAQGRQEVKSVNTVPEFVRDNLPEGQLNRWLVYSHESDRNKEGKNLFVLHHMLSTFVSTHFLRGSDWSRWMRDNIRLGQSTIFMNDG